MKNFKIAFLLLVLSANFSFSASDEERYLENKRRQLEIQTRQANEAKQALEAYKSSFEALQKQKMDDLVRKERDINATLAKIEATRAENERIMMMNRQSLEKIDKKKGDRVQEIYSQMKDAAVAQVLNEMPASEATKVILTLESRKISSVLAKMEPKKASELTLLIKEVRENNATKPQSKATSEANSNDLNQNPANSNFNISLNDPNNTTSSQDNASGINP